MTKAPSPFPELAASIIRRVLVEAADYLEREPVDALHMRMAVGSWVFDVVARPRTGASVEMP
jgi:hypothetical protein